MEALYADSVSVLRQRLSAVPPRQSRVGGARDVLTWIVFGLTAWLAIGVLTASLFGAVVSIPESDTSA